MKKLILLAAFFGFGSQAFAAGYGAAGCGLGSMLFEGKNQWYEQVLAATTNGTLANQTFGITFGSLNCDAIAVTSSKERASVFVAANKNAVINEISMGKGENIAVLAELMNCSDRTEFGQTMKTNYKGIVTDSNISPEALVDNISKFTTESGICNPNLG